MRFDKRSQSPLYLMVGGMPRSGTTIVVETLRKNFRIKCIPETHFFDIALRAAGHIDISSLPKAALSDPQLMAAYRQVCDLDSIDDIDRFELLLQYYFEAKGRSELADAVLEKTPAHLLSFRSIASVKNYYRFVVVVRRCGDVCASLGNVEWNNRSILQNARRWMRYQFEAILLMKSYPNRVMIWKYEEFVSSAESHMQMTQEFLGIPRSPGGTGDATFDSILEPWKANALHGPSHQTHELSVLLKLLNVMGDLFWWLLTSIPFRKKRGGY